VRLEAVNPAFWDYRGDKFGSFFVDGAGGVKDEYSVIDFPNSFS
jgi:hypothetical protein